MKREQSSHRKQMEGLERKIVDSINKKIATFQNQQKKEMQSILESIQKLESMNILPKEENTGTTTPFSVPTIRRKRYRSRIPSSQEYNSKRVQDDNAIETRVSQMIQTAILTKRKNDLFLIDDFFFAVYSKREGNDEYIIVKKWILQTMKSY